MCVLSDRTLSNWVYEFDKWAPTVIKVSFKVRPMNDIKMRVKVKWKPLSLEWKPRSSKSVLTCTGRHLASSTELAATTPPYLTWQTLAVRLQWLELSWQY